MGNCVITRDVSCTMGVYYPSVGYNIEVGLPAYSAMVGYMQGFHFSFTSWQLVTDVSVDSPPPLLSRDKEFCCVVSSGFSLGRVHVARLISPLWWHALHNSSVMLLFCLLSCSNWFSCWFWSSLLTWQLWIIFESSCPWMTFAFWLCCWFLPELFVTLYSSAHLSSFWAACC